MNSIRQPAHPAARTDRVVFSWAESAAHARHRRYTFMWPAGASSPISRRSPRFLSVGLPFPKLLTPSSPASNALAAPCDPRLFTRIPAAIWQCMIVAIKSAKWGDVDSLETLLGFEEMTYFAASCWLAIEGPGAPRWKPAAAHATGIQEST